MTISEEMVAGLVTTALAAVGWFLKYKLSRLDHRITRLDKLSTDHFTVEADLKERIGKLEASSASQKDLDDHKRDNIVQIEQLKNKIARINDSMKVLGFDYSQSARGALHQEDSLPTPTSSIPISYSSEPNVSIVAMNDHEEEDE